MLFNELKDYINNDSLYNDFLIFKYEDNPFIAKQYCDGIAQMKNLEIRYIDSLHETESSSMNILLSDDDNFLYILETENFDEVASDYSKYINTIVICNKIDKTIKNAVSQFVVDFYKVDDWHNHDYILTVCDGLSQRDAEWLTNVTSGNIYRINNELDKLLLFNKEQRHNILIELKNDQYSDLYNQPIFTLSDALIKRDMLKITDCLLHRNCADFDPLPLIKILFMNYKKILFLCFGYTGPLDKLGVSDRAAYSIRNNYRNLSLDKVKRDLEFISNVDLEIKLGKLDMSKDNLLDYIISNILA